MRKDTAVMNWKSRYVNLCCPNQNYCTLFFLAETDGLILKFIWNRKVLK